MDHQGAVVQTYLKKYAKPNSAGRHDNKYSLLANVSASMFVWIKYIIIRVHSRCKDIVECATKIQGRDAKSVDVIFMIFALKSGMEVPYFPVYKRPLCIRDPSIFRQNFQEKSFLVIKRLTPMYKRPPIFKVKIMNKKGSLIHGKIR